jgi:hypothetical protein
MSVPDRFKAATWNVPTSRLCLKVQQLLQGICCSRSRPNVVRVQQAECSSLQVRSGCLLYTLFGSSVVWFKLCIRFVDHISNYCTIFNTILVIAHWHLQFWRHACIPADLPAERPSALADRLTMLLLRGAFVHHLRSLSRRHQRDSRIYVLIMPAAARDN